MKKSNDLRKNIAYFFVGEMIFGVVCFYFLSPETPLYLEIVAVIEVFIIAVVSGFVIVIINNKFEFLPINDCKSRRGRIGIFPATVLFLFLFLFLLLHDFIPCREPLILSWLAGMNVFLMANIICHS